MSRYVKHDVYRLEPMAIGVHQPHEDLPWVWLWDGENELEFEPVHNQDLKTYESSKKKASRI